MRDRFGYPRGAAVFTTDDARARSDSLAATVAVDAALGLAAAAPALARATIKQATAKTVTALIREIRREGIKALFLENISDPRLMQEIARETGASLGPPLYSDALSGPEGPAPTYVRMIEYNTAALQAVMLRN